MANSNSKRKPVSARRHHPEPQHTSTLRRRLSLGFGTFMSVVPLRKTTPQQEPYLLATTAPSPTRPLLPHFFNSSQVTERQIPNPQIHLPSLAESQEPCPYDQTKYHSFRRIECSRCTFCGMRSSRPGSSEPCEDCRSKSRFSHIKLGFRPKPMSSSSKVKPPSPGDQPRYSFSSDECPRIVSPEIAAKRIGNPPRRAALPVPRQGAINNVLNTRPNHPASDSAKPSSGPRSESALQNEQVRATSPRLHHLHGLPDSKAYPYVHKREVQQHFAAIRAGASSPLAEFAIATQQKRGQNQSIDFSETIYYGRIPKPALVSDVHKPFPEQARRGDIFVEHTLIVGGHVLTERSQSERRCSVNEQSYSSPAPARRSPVRPAQQPRVERVSNKGETYSTASTGGKLCGNTNSKVKIDPQDETLLGLRGGGDNNAYYPGCGFIFKQLLLTCRRSRRDMSDMSSDDDNVPPRIPDPVQIARKKRRAQGTARLPKHLVRGCEPQATSRTTIVSFSGSSDAEILPLPAAEVIPLPRRVTFAPTYKPPRPLICRLPSFTRSSASRSTTQPQARKFPIGSALLSSQSATSIIPCLRGGAGSPSTLRDDQNLPPTIFWLAGGDRRKTMQTASWKAQRPKARRGGLMGWAVHGLQAGKAYRIVEGAEGGKEEKDGAGARKDGGEAGGGESAEVSGGREGKKDEGSSSEGDSIGVAKEGEPKRGVALDPVPEVA